MRVLPVIERELRVQARLGFTYGLRVLGATTLLFVCLYFGAREGFESAIGGRLFGYLNTTLFISIWIMVPMLAGDCISRERREGTLGLLFMTSLRAREIVLAKVLVHGLRAMTLWLAIVPVITICFLLGGVTWKEGVMSLLVNFSMICWALAAGLIASAVSKVWLRAQLVACGLGFCFAAAFLLLSGYAILGTAGRDPSFQLPHLFGAYRARGDFSGQAWGMGLFAVTDLEGWWGTLFGSLKPGNQSAWYRAEIGITIFSVLLLLMAVEIAAFILRRLWQQNPPRPSQVWLEQQLTTPVVGVGLFRFWLRRKLERNPIGWLEQRTWSGRLVMWGWLAVLISIYSALFSSNGLDRIIDPVQNLLGWTLVCTMAATAAGSFRRERETGLLELLLVSPLVVSQIIFGRLRGLWGQFLPALVIISAVWMYFTQVFHLQLVSVSIQFLCVSFVTIPVVGLYHSLRRPNFVSAFLFTLFWGLLLPVCIRLAVESLKRAIYGPDPEPVGVWGNQVFYNIPLRPLEVEEKILNLLLSPLFTSLLQIGLAIWFFRRLQRDMESRNFTINRAEN